ncbi:MAG: tRNA pseudouridine(55) synthase TruB [Fimbriimonas sp.]
MLGVLLINKPKGLTSHDIVNTMRRRFSTRRVGHAGTLDPMATGLLVVAIGPATRFLQYLPLEPKEYVATIQFGRTTDSYDAEGVTVAEAEVPEDLERRIHAAIPGFMGLIQQTPPMFSAVKVRGKPLYSYARKGQELVRESRTVHISTYEILSVEGTQATARIVCSGGTYIRSLAYDLGEVLGCGAHLCALQRTKVGRFSHTQAKELDEVGPADLVSLNETLPPMPLIQLNEMQTRRVREGQPVGLAEPPPALLVALLEPSGAVFSVARVQGNLLMPECVIPSEALHEDS